MPDQPHIISSYSRAEAIEDGELVDVSTMAKEAGLRLPTVVTRAVWYGCIVPDAEAQALGQDTNGRLWDLLFMAHQEIRRSNVQQEEAARKAPVQRGTNEVPFKVIFTKGKKQATVDLKIHCGPGDNREPVLTIMLRGES